MVSHYKRGRNPRSLANLGKKKTKAGRFNFTLSKQSAEWLSRQPNKSAAIDQLIDERQNMDSDTRNAFDSLAHWLEKNVGSVKNDVVLIYCLVSNRSLWIYQDEDSEDLERMYGVEVADAAPSYIYEWIGSSEDPHFWEYNAKRILADRLAGKIQVKTPEGSTKEFDLTWD